MYGGASAGLVLIVAVALMVRGKPPQAEPTVPVAEAVTAKQVVPPKSSEPPKQRFSGGRTKYAFIVAVSHYDEQNGLKPLPFTVKDVEGFRDSLLASGYEAKNIRMLHDELPTAQNPGFRFVPKKAEIMAELALLLKFVEPDDSVIVALNGHGVHLKGDKTSHFCPLNADLGRKTNLLPMDGPDGLYPLLEKCQAKSKLLIAGMCRNDPKEFPADSQAAESIDLSAPENRRKVSPPCIPVRPASGRTSIRTRGATSSNTCRPRGAATTPGTRN